MQRVAMELGRCIATKNKAMSFSYDAILLVASLEVDFMCWSLRFLIKTLLLSQKNV